MAETDDTWSSNANEALTVSLVTPVAGQLKTVSSFHPKFTYPIFGEEEQIFGYQNLKINLRYNASDMRPHLSTTYGKKFKAIGDTEPADIEEMLRPFLPAVAFQKSKEFEQTVTSLPENWTPPGDKVQEFNTSQKGHTFEVWRGSLGDRAVKQLVSRIQILVSLFIEGGTPLDVDEPDADRWTVFFLYTKYTDPATKRQVYMFGGYCTVYRFYLYQPPSPPASPAEKAQKDDLDLGDGNFDLSQLPCRSRISQFIIIPSFQGKGVGSHFYQAIFSQYLKHPQTVELTVEDPNEAFDDMRDLCDLSYLRTVPDFLKLRINTSIKLPRDGAVPKTIIDPEAYEKLRRKVKIAPRQFARALEMQLMSQLPDSVRPGITTDEEETTSNPKAAEEHEYGLWKLLVKARLYRQHKDILGQLDVAERLEKLEETVASVEFEYARLLVLLESRVNKSRQELENSSNGKRKAEDAAEEESASKKARVEDA
ncbi:histone acetyl transferase HAT1-like protein [Coniochaeta ligniaria NRRL 30616]|uniref:Histone acetyltransferase type B catalytic subunit n=1 Tax=Coniochaeta ligniaria NRRL 30616 TaxID=1408157 RepID=A0A1J7JTZ9_9PEZI|nr:histone acetyl transferase HAT1-like protein [Coniochaeta ligniaria NRRL 30616]